MHLLLWIFCLRNDLSKLINNRNISLEKGWKITLLWAKHEECFDKSSRGNRTSWKSLIVKIFPRSSDEYYFQLHVLLWIFYLRSDLTDKSSKKSEGIFEKNVKIPFYEYSTKKALTRELKTKWNILQFSRSKDRFPQF